MVGRQEEEDVANHWIKMELRNVSFVLLNYDSYLEICYLQAMSYLMVGILIRAQALRSLDLLNWLTFLGGLSLKLYLKIG